MPERGKKIPFIMTEEMMLEMSALCKHLKVPFKPRYKVGEIVGYFYKGKDKRIGMSNVSTMMSFNKWEDKKDDGKLQNRK